MTTTDTTAPGRQPSERADDAVHGTSKPAEQGSAGPAFPAFVTLGDDTATGRCDASGECR